MGTNELQGEIGCIYVKNHRTDYYAFDFLCRKSFLDYIASYYKDELTIVIPEKTDLEQYVFELEMIMKDQYNININGCKFNYIYSNEIVEKLPTFLDKVVMDTKCFSNECNRYKDLLEHVKGELE